MFFDNNFRPILGFFPQETWPPVPIPSRGGIYGIWGMDSAKQACEYRVAGYQVRKLEEGERRGTLLKEAVGLGRDASPSSDKFVLPIES
jgi:hypothetical protein